MNKKLALDCLESFIRIQSVSETLLYEDTRNKLGCQDLIDRLKSEILGEESKPVVTETNEFKVGDKVFCDWYMSEGIVTSINDECLNFPIRVELSGAINRNYTKDGRYTENGKIRLKKI